MRQTYQLWAAMSNPNAARIWNSSRGFLDEWSQREWPALCQRRRREREPLGAIPALDDIDHSRTKTKSLQTNGIAERFRKTIVNEFKASGKAESRHSRSQ